MSFLKGKNIKEEYEEKEDDLNKLREERRNNYLNIGHILEDSKLLFSEDKNSIPYIQNGEDEYLINGEKCYETGEDNNNLKYNDYIVNYESEKFDYEHLYEHIKFKRDRTQEENIFMNDYNKLVSYKLGKYITDFKPNTNNKFTLEIFNKLKDKLKNDLIKLKQLEAEEKIKNYNPEESKQRLDNLIDNYDYNKQLNKINQDTQKQLKMKDEEFNNELYKKHQLQIANARQELKPEHKYNENRINFKLDNGGYPYRSYSKLKSLYDDFNTYKFKSMVKPLNNFDVKESKNKYSLKTYSNVKNSFIGDIFFESKISAFLLLINISTRYAYAYQLGNVDIKEIINIDENNKEYQMSYTTKGKKTTQELKKAFKKFLQDTKVNILRFDGERAIGSEDFKKYLKKNNIKFIPAIPGVHTSLSLIDRLCRTIRDIAFNLNYEGIYNQEQMNKVLNYYNQSRHETLTQTLFKAYPELKEIFKFISPWIMEHNELDLETKFVKECIKYNYYIKLKPDYKINNDEEVKIYNDVSKLDKRRTNLSKDNYKVINKNGNIYKLQNADDEIIFKPRFQIKKSNTFKSSKLNDYDDIMKYFKLSLI